MLRMLSAPAPREVRPISDSRSNISGAFFAWISRSCQIGARRYVGVTACQIIGNRRHTPQLMSIENTARYGATGT